MITTEQRIADRFAALLRDELGDEDFNKILERNSRKSDDSSGCASHDFLDDANGYMLEAFAQITGAEMGGHNLVKVLFEYPYLIKPRTRLYPVFQHF